MNIIKRSVQDIIEKWLFKGKVITVYGARQVGKTTMAKALLKKWGNENDYFNCDILTVRDAFKKQDPNALKRIIGESRFIVIDEAQRIENIGLILKIMHDSFPDVQIVATGSSSFELSNKINEPLTGRALEFILYPFSIAELKSIYTPIELDGQIEHFLRFGSYPEIADKNEKDAMILLDNLSSKYLYKDILEFEQIKKPKKLIKLLQLLAFQLGNEVSKHELATKLSINRETVERYLDLLEKSFVIFRLGSFSRNLRKELTKKEKIYFYDIGIRNSLIAKYNTLEFRDDTGALFENFCIVERMKYIQRIEEMKNQYFWRTHDKKEIDYVEESDGKLEGFEFKWKKGSFKKPIAFLESYENSSISLVNRDNFWDFIGM